MNETLYNVAARLTDDKRKRDLRCFFRSLHGTLYHVLLAERAWLGRFTGDPAISESRDATGASIPITGLAQELYSDFVTLRRERAATDAAIERWGATLDDAALDRTFRYRGTSGAQFEH